MPQIDHRAAQPDTRRVLFCVERRVIETCRNDVCHGVTRRHARNELAHEQACDRGVAVGEIEVPARLRFATCVRVAEVHPRKPGVAFQPGHPGRQRVGTDRPHAVRPFLHESEHLVAHPGVFLEVIAPAVRFDDRAPLCRRHSRKVVLLVGGQAFQLRPGLR